MPLRVGDAAPDFRALDGDGHEWTLARLAGRAFVLFFYPRDETPGCIAQACSYRDAWADFGSLQVPVLGVSRDSTDSHRDFAKRRRLPFPLLSDEAGTMHKAYRARTYGLFPGRVSYLVGPDGRVAAAFDSHLRPEAHAAEMLTAAQRLLPRVD